MGVDTEEVLLKLDRIPISIHCWQGDDVRGFENPDGELTGGIQTSGNYPGPGAKMPRNCAPIWNSLWRKFQAESVSTYTLSILNRLPR